MIFKCIFNLLLDPKFVGKLTEEQKRDQVCFEDCFTKEDLKAIFRQKAGSMAGPKKLTTELIFKLDDLVIRIYNEKKEIKVKKEI
jgi:hypothetical protein